MPDIAIEHAGSMEAAYAIAEANGISVTATLAAGQELVVPVVADAATADWFATGRRSHPASEIN